MSDQNREYKQRYKVTSDIQELINALAARSDLDRFSVGMIEKLRRTTPKWGITEGQINWLQKTFNELSEKQLDKADIRAASGGAMSVRGTSDKVGVVVTPNVTLSNACSLEDHIAATPGPFKAILNNDDGQMFNVTYNGKSCFSFRSQGIARIMASWLNDTYKSGDLVALAGIIAAEKNTDIPQF